ncbi:MAG TPA: metal-dependent hydrolase [Blastocatellia bacterium]|nr:metal-dependent hydrolase [Blastocatellia bacterium]
MDNLTHTLLGAALAETGLKRWTPFATATLIIGANFPDIDIITWLFGQDAYLEHHRGLTHALALWPLLSVLLAGMIFLFSRWRKDRSKDIKLRARFGPLLILSLLSIITHPLLDFTNSYGWKPFQPWNNNWYYGDTAFVIDPWVWLLLGGALCLATAKTHLRLILWAILFVILAVTIFTLGPRTPLKSLWAILAICILAIRTLTMRRKLPARSIAIASLTILLAYFGTRVWLHRNTIDQLNARAAEIISNGQVKQVNALPTPLNPLHWQAVFVTDQKYYVTDYALNQSSITDLVQYPRESGDTAAIAAARQTPQFQTFLRFARFPVFEAIPAPNQTIEVAVSDVRFIDVNRQARSSFRRVVRLDQNLKPIVEN